jgi:nucleoside-diphosphate-sugar epimerase
VKKILITGANGFVCSNVIDVLLTRDWYIYAADVAFDNPAVRHWPSDQVTLLEDDITALPALNVDALFHGAAITAGPDQRGETPEDNFMANLEPALAMLRYAETNAIPRSIFVSSSAVYRSSDRGLITEDMPASPLGCYPVAKATIEGLVETLRRLHDRDVLCIRLGNLYGPHELTRASRPHTSLIQQVISQALNGTIRIDDHVLPREWTFVRDVGAAVDVLLRAPGLSHAVYNAAAGEVYSVQDIARAVETALVGRAVTVVTQSTGQSDSLTRLGTPDTSRLLHDTGFHEWTSLDDGIRQTVNAMLQEVDRA